MNTRLLLDVAKTTKQETAALSQPNMSKSKTSCVSYGWYMWNRSEYAVKITVAEEQISGSPGRREVHRHLHSLCETKNLALKCLASALQYLHK
ncbi:hypothetical protein DV515_00004215 [Chloebia gouldiae]|uniref:Uncharacterized protein n=1 Tax=Chloebia gouldiae TaxID=44316 RepID=A0A3L8SRD0_CHLGU|nr:hypothetical protein DV515_00004215 [Chloebia gouldiae]